jgi:hypothetical protein
VSVTACRRCGKPTKLGERCEKCERDTRRARLKAEVLERDRYSCTECGAPARFVARVPMTADSGPSGYVTLCPKCLDVHRGKPHRR